MFFRKNKAILMSLMLVAAFVLPAFAQKEGTVSQRLQVMRERLDTMKRSLESAASSLKDDAKQDKSKKIDKAALDTPYARITSLQKDVQKASSEVNAIRGKSDRAEKFEPADVDAIEATVAELSTRVDNTLTETAKERALPTSTVGQQREVKKKTKKLLGLIPYGSEKDEYEELIGSVTPGRDRELFIVATREVRKGNSELGRLLFQTIITTYPDSQYLPMSKLAVADSFYLEGGTSNMIQARSGYQDWLTFFPTHALAPFVLLKIVECEMRQIGLPDRDVTNAKRAEQKLQAFYQQYANSPIRAEADIRMKEVQDNIALHNLSIGNQYYKQSVDYKKGGLKGAQSRFKEIIEKYPNFTFMDEPLFKIAQTFQIEEETEEAAKYYQRLVRDFPHSDYVEKAKEQLQLMGAAIPEPNPETKDKLPPEKASFIQNFKNEFFGIYPMTIDKNGVLMTKDFDKKKFELIDQIIENQGDLNASQVPKSLTTYVRDVPETQQKAQVVKTAAPPVKTQEN